MSQSLLRFESESSDYDSPLLPPFPSHSLTMDFTHLNFCSSAKLLPCITYWMSHTKNKEFKLYINNYELKEIIGAGTFSKVLDASDITQNDKSFAVKFFSIDACLRNRSARYLQNNVEIITEYDKIWDEIVFNLLIDHPSICKLIEVLYSYEKNMLYFVLESLPYRSLYWSCTEQHYFIPIQNIEFKRSLANKSFLYLYTEQGARIIFKQIINAVEHCHSKGIIHKDIKPENVMLQNKIPEKYTIYFNTESLTALDNLINEIGDIHNQGSFITKRSSNSFRNDEFYLWEEGPCFYECSKNEKALEFKMKSQMLAITLKDVINGTTSKWNLNSMSISSSQETMSHRLLTSDFSSPSLPNNEATKEENTNSLCIISKLIDFNSASLTKRPEMKIYDSEGTSEFSPPECLSLSGTDGINGKARDIWSLGCFLYALIFGLLPFRGSNSLELYLKIKQHQLEFPSFREISLELNHILKSLLATSVNQRITIEEIKVHPWLTRNLPKIH